MKIGLIDVDGHHFPNIALMKLSAYHKQHGDTVDWYRPLLDGHLDECYISKVFSFTPDYETAINADEIIYGGSGYAISTDESGRETCRGYLANNVGDACEHLMPDYSLYGITDTAYGYLSIGCPRNCGFCHVCALQGKKSVEHADLSEWWDGRPKIKLLDPNILACRDRERLLLQLAESKARVDMTQGVDARLLTVETIYLINRIKSENIHFAWDTMEQSDAVLNGLRLYDEYGKITRTHRHVYVLTNYDTTHDEDLYRVETLRTMGYEPYVMIYNKQSAPKVTRDLQRWTNNKKIWRECERFEDYKKGKISEA